MQFGHRSISIPFENLSFNETVLIQGNFGGAYAGGVLSSIFRQPQTEFPAVTLLFHRPSQNQVRYKDLQVNLQKRFGWFVIFFEGFNFGFG
jgi:hypothetical protein